MKNTVQLLAVIALVSTSCQDSKKAFHSGSERNIQSEDLAQRLNDRQITAEQLQDFKSLSINSFFGNILERISDRPIVIDGITFANMRSKLMELRSESIDSTDSVRTMGELWPVSLEQVNAPIDAASLKRTYQSAYSNLQGIGRYNQVSEIISRLRANQAEADGNIELETLSLADSAAEPLDAGTCKLLTDSLAAEAAKNDHGDLECLRLTKEAIDKQEIDFLEDMDSAAPCAAHLEYEAQTERLLKSTGCDQTASPSRK